MSNNNASIETATAGTIHRSRFFPATSKAYCPVHSMRSPGRSAILPAATSPSSSARVRST
jgi:hypothetical protein